MHRRGSITIAALLGKRAVAWALAVIGLLCANALAPQAALGSVVETYYVPIPEDQLRNAMVALQGS